MKSISFFKGLSWLIVLNLLVKPVWIFFIDRQVQNLVGLEAYGKYFAAFNLSFVLIFLADAGLSNMLNQNLAAGKGLRIPQLLKLKALLLVSYVLVCGLAGWIAGLEQWEIFLYIVAVQALTSLFTFLRGIITASQFFTADALFSVLDKFLMIFLCGGFIYGIFGAINLIIFLQLQLLCTALSVIIAFVFLSGKNIITSSDRLSPFAIGTLVVPFAAIILLMSLHYRLDGFLLERIHVNGPLEAGIYASAYRLLDAANMAGYLTASFLVPFISRHAADKQLVGSTILKTRHSLMVMSVLIVSFTIVFAPWLQQLLYHTGTKYNSLILQLCLAALPAYYLVHIYGSALTATGNFKKFITILLAAVCLNTTLNIILIPSHGALGCCIAALASQYFCAITLHISAVRRLSISAGLKSHVLYFLFAAMLIVLFYLGKQIIADVWVLLAIICLAPVVLVITQIKYFRKNFFSHA